MISIGYVPLPEDIPNLLTNVSSRVDIKCEFHPLVKSIPLCRRFLGKAHSFHQNVEVDFHIVSANCNNQKSKTFGPILRLFPGWVGFSRAEKLAPSNPVTSVHNDRRTASLAVSFVFFFEWKHNLIRHFNQKQFQWNLFRLKWTGVLNSQKNNQNESNKITEELQQKKTLDDWDNKVLPGKKKHKQHGVYSIYLLLFTVSFICFLLSFLVQVSAAATSSFQNLREDAWQIFQRDTCHPMKRYCVTANPKKKQKHNTFSS